MITKKLLPIVLCVLLTSCVFSREMSLDTRGSGRFANQSLTTSKENFDQNFVAKMKESFNELEDLDDARQNENLGTKDLLNKGSISRNMRAVDNLSSTDYSKGKNVQQVISEKSKKKETSKNINQPREKNSKMYNLADENGVCPGIDIRNDVKFLQLLKDCVVIEGYLQIVLIEKFQEKDFENYTFPKLREITGYLLLYRIDSIKNFNRLFPNLEVIRGNILLTDFSFVIYELQNLQEIGLQKLTQISRGGIRIEKNPSLCYTTTLDWDAIVVAGEKTIKDNRNESSCPGCSQCPGGHCWGAQLCQETHKPKCHAQCLGECNGSTESDCFVCKQYRHKGKCIEKCPDDLYSYLSRRCISRSECYNIVKTKKNSEEKILRWRPFNQSCVLHCPDGFEDSIDQNNMTSCRKCDGLCRREFHGAIIHHISDAQAYRGITVVKGALEFQIRSGNPNIMNELTDAFGQIEEITDYLKVTHSFPINDLGFFKKLKVIGGKKLDINNSSLVILDNPNLSSLFRKNQQIQILNGRLFFHFNPKLCLQTILSFSRMVGIPDPTELEVQPESNGDKVACEVVAINMTVSEQGPDYAKLEWNSYTPHTSQFLLSYLLHYLETENTNVTYEGNSCGNNTWQIKDVVNPNANSTRETTVSKLITNLKPYTRYAVYVKTFTARDGGRDKYRRKESIDEARSARIVGQSKIIYFRTKSDIPSVPTNLVSFPASESEIVVKWNPPVEPNGPIAYYMVSGFIRPDNEELSLSRNYCEFGLVDEAEAEAEDAPEITIKTTVVDSPSCCTKDTETKVVTSKKFEIFCHEGMTIDYTSPGKRSYCRSERHGLADPGYQTVYNGSYYRFVFNVSAQTNSHILQRLRHFSTYTIAVAACGHTLENGTQLCSPIEYTTTRTGKRPYADNVRDVRARERTLGNSSSVIVSWDPPKNPNGITVSYTIEYINTDVKDAKKVVECVPMEIYRRKRGTHEIRDLSPGRYSLKVRSTSLAGDGEFSEAVKISISVKEDNFTIIAILLPLALFLAIGVFVFLLFRSHQKRKTQERLIASVNPDYIETKYVVDEWEVSRDDIEILDEVGNGNFGMVFRGHMKPGLDRTIDVAIKTIRDTASERERNEFLNEASVMKNFSTFHIIKLLGVVSIGNPPLVIMEFMHNGDLKTYLRKIRESQKVPGISRIIRMAAEIADGMAYLESKKFVHRDLAARNCMVSRDLVCKVGDFGMARDIYETDYYKVGQKGLLPIRWMAPENLCDGVFTSDSDVWSYGVVLYEIFTLAEMPYQGYSNDDVLSFVLRKGKLTIPPQCPDHILTLVEKCFRWKPSERPTFMEIVAELEPFLGQDFCEKSFYHSDAGSEIRQLGIKKVYHNAAPIRLHWGNETARWVKDFEDNVSLLDQTRAGTSRGRIFKNGFQPFGNVSDLEDVPLDR